MSPTAFKLRILIVDDDLDQCKMVSNHLKKNGHNPTFTTNPFEAVKISDEQIELLNPFHVYIIDMRMPKMDGMETARQIKVKATNVVFIAHTVCDSVDDKKKIFTSGYFKYLFSKYDDIKRMLSALVVIKTSFVQGHGILPEDVIIPETEIGNSL